MWHILLIKLLFLCIFYQFRLCISDFGSIAELWYPKTLRDFHLAFFYAHDDWYIVSFMVYLIICLAIYYAVLPCTSISCLYAYMLSFCLFPFIELIWLLSFKIVKYVTSLISLFLALRIYVVAVWLSCFLPNICLSYSRLETIFAIVFDIV